MTGWLRMFTGVAFASRSRLSVRLTNSRIIVSPTPLLMQSRTASSSFFLASSWAGVCAISESLS